METAQAAAETATKAARFVVKFYRRRWEHQWKVVDTTTGKSVCTGFYSEASADAYAAKCEANPPAIKAERERGATHCQICGGDVLASKGVIAHHGYRRPGQGWQTSSCLGARFRPYEVACDRLPEVIAIVKAHVASQTETHAAEEANPPAVLTYLDKNYQPAKRVEVARPADFKASDAVLGWRSYGALYQARLRDLRADIADSTETASALRARLRAWKPKA